VADVLLLAVDPWGGVTSMIVLAGGLRDLGVSTRIAAYSDFGDKVRAAGCDFVDLEVSQADWWESQNAQQSDWAKNPLRTLKAMRVGGKADARATATRLADIVKPGEGIVSGTLSVGTAAGVAALRGSQLVAVHPGPMTPSHLAEGALNPVTRRPSLANEWSGRLAAHGAGWILRPAVNEGRQALGLPPWTARDYRRRGLARLALPPARRRPPRRFRHHAPGHPGGGAEHGRPISFDQPYWGRRLAQIGVGAAPVPYRRLTPAALARAIRQMTATPAIAARAKELSAVLSAECGPAAAAGTIATALTRQRG
jgi:hypothetical protein